MYHHVSLVARRSSFITILLIGTVLSLAIWLLFVKKRPLTTGPARAKELPFTIEPMIFSYSPFASDVLIVKSPTLL